jgi:hypothetical protein
MINKTKNIIIKTFLTKLIKGENQREREIINVKCHK